MDAEAAAAAGGSGGGAACADMTMADSRRTAGKDSTDLLLASRALLESAKELDQRAEEEEAKTGVKKDLNTRLGAVLEAKYTVTVAARKATDVLNFLSSMMLEWDLNRDGHISKMCAAYVCVCARARA